MVNSSDSTLKVTDFNFFAGELSACVYGAYWPVGLLHYYYYIKKNRACKALVIRQNFTLNYNKIILNIY